MRFAPIVPIGYDPASVTNTHLILAHEVLANEETAQYYASLNPYQHMVILDNGVVEIGSSVSHEQLISAWVKAPYAWCVVPDSMGNREETILLGKQFITHLPHYPLLNKLMIVPQGKTINEWLDCLDYLRGVTPSKPVTCMLGIPRITEDWAGGREQLLKLSRWQDRVWLLGIQHRLSEVYWSWRYSMVQGVDSSLPARAAQASMSSLFVKDLRKLPDTNGYQRHLHDKVRHEISTIRDHLREQVV